MLGYIGLGFMGGAIARRLLEAHPLLVYDLNPAAIETLTAAGAQAASSVAQVAQNCDVVILCLPTSAHVKQVALGDDGIVAHAKAGTIIVDQTSGDPAETRSMAERLDEYGIKLIDAPVSGGPRRADAGNLAIMIGAAPGDYMRVRDIFTAISSNVFHAGDVGAGNIAKLCNNLLLGAQQVMTLEAIALAVKNGVRAETICDIMIAGTGNNYYLSNVVKTHTLKGKLQYTGSLGSLHKDISLACKLADTSGVALMTGGLTRALFQHAVNELGPETSVIALALVVERLAGVRVVPLPHDLSK